MLMDMDKKKIISLVSFFTTQTKFCGRTKLAKLLFYCDWKHLKETGRTITGLAYLAFPYGPLPENLNTALKDSKSEFGKFIRYREGDEKAVQPIRVTESFDDKLFTPFELRILKEAAFIFEEATSDQMVRISHGIDQPWTITKEKKGLYQPIDEQMAFSEKDAKISLEDYLERKEEDQETRRMMHGSR